jgi:hypothetical protein
LQLNTEKKEKVALLMSSKHCEKNLGPVFGRTISYADGLMELRDFVGT